MADELDGFLQFLARYRAAKRGEWSRKQSIDEDFPDPSLFDRHMEEIVSWIKKGFVICSASGNSDAALLSCLLSDHAVINLSPGIAYKLNFASRERLAPEEIVPWNAVVAVEETVDLIRNGRLRLLVERCITGNMTSHAILAAGLNLDDFPSGRRPSWYIWDGGENSNKRTPLAAADRW